MRNVKKLRFMMYEEVLNYYLFYVVFGVLFSVLKQVQQNKTSSKF